MLLKSLEGGVRVRHFQISPPQMTMINHWVSKASVNHSAIRANPSVIRQQLTLRPQLGTRMADVQEAGWLLASRKPLLPHGTPLGWGWGLAQLLLLLKGTEALEEPPTWKAARAGLFPVGRALWNPYQVRMASGTQAWYMLICLAPWGRSLQPQLPTTVLPSLNLADLGPSWVGDTS
jgi:hypothetical protein